MSDGLPGRGNGAPAKDLQEKTRPSYEQHLLMEDEQPVRDPLVDFARGKFRGSSRCSGAPGPAGAAPGKSSSPFPKQLQHGNGRSAEKL